MTQPPHPTWQQPWAPQPAPLPATSEGPRGRMAPALAAALGAVAGAVGAGVLVTLLFVGAAGDIGRGIGAELAPALREGITEGVTDGMERSMEDAMSFAEEEALTGALGPVDEFPAVAPGDLGPDPVLDGYAADCFAGDLQACDDLYFEAPPLSRYESYAVTCGGRVKEYAVAACTELE